MKKLLIIIFVLCIAENLTYADRTYTYVRTVGQDSKLYDFTTINEAIADIMRYNLTSESLGCIEVYDGIYVEQLNEYYPGGHNLPAHCDLLGMGATPRDVVIQHKRRSESDPNFTNIVSEIYADGVLCDGDNIVENLKIENVWPNQNSIEFRGAGTLKNCIVESDHDAVTASGHLVVSGCTIEGWYRPCIHAYSTFEVSDCTFYPKTRSWGGQHPAGIKATKSGTIDNVTIEADIVSSDYEPHYDTPWLAGVILQLRNPDDTVTISNARINLRLTTLYHDNRPGETADWELFGVVSGGRNPKPTTYYPGRAIVENCQIDLTGLEDSSNPNGDGRAIMVAGVCVQGGGRVDVIGNTSIKTSRTSAGYGEDGYEYSLNNQNGILTVDFNTVDFDETITNGVITTYDPNESHEPNEPNEPDLFLSLPIQTIIPYAERMEQEKAQSLKVCPVGAGLRPATEPLSVKENKSRELSFNGERGGGMMMGGRGVIDVNSDITSNQVWTADNTYHVLADISVQALLVIEPNTIVVFAPNKSMSVNNGGTLISVGTADNPIIYTSDLGTPGYDDYYCPMYIEETASTNTKIMYSYVEYAYAGLVVLNNELGTDIQNNYFYNNVYGIVEQGIKHTPIRNNLAVASYYSGIEVFLADVNGQASSDSFILIENNTCDYYQDNGITVHGVNDVNEAGVVVLANNIVSGSYQYGLALVDYYMYATVTNTGYFDNANNKNWEFEEENPAFETVLPYETGTGTLPVCYLRQDCNFVDAGFSKVEFTELIGKTTDVNGIPDSNITDIGFHYYDWSFVNAGDGSTLDWDLTGNLIVNFKDFAIFANGWQTTYDINDLATFTDEWLDSISGHPQISVYVSGDPCNLSGDVMIRVNDMGYQTEQAFVLIDGQYVDEIIGYDDGYGVTLETYAFGNGEHSIKIVTVDPNSLITVSPAANVIFNNELYYVSIDEDYQSGQDYRITAMYNGSHNLLVKVLDIEDNVIWSDVFAGNLNITIPPATFGGNSFYDVSINETGMSLSGYKSWAKKVSKKFKPGTADPNTVLLISCPDKGVAKARWRSGAIPAVIGAAERKGYEYTVLYGSNCKYENLAWCLTALSHLRHWYHVGHGNAELKVGGKSVNRTSIKIKGGNLFSYNRKDFDPNATLPWYENIGKYEKAKTALSIRIPSGRLRITHIDACYSGKNRDFEWVGDNHGDMSFCLGIHHENQIYLGWGKRAYVNDILFYFGEWVENVWYRLGFDESVAEALLYAASHTPPGPYGKGPHDTHVERGHNIIPGSIRFRRY